MSARRARSRHASLVPLDKRHDQIFRPVGARSLLIAFPVQRLDLPLERLMLLDFCEVPIERFLQRIFELFDSRLLCGAVRRLVLSHRLSLRARRSAQRSNGSASSRDSTITPIFFPLWLTHSRSMRSLVIAARTFFISSCSLSLTLFPHAP